MTDLTDLTIITNHHPRLVIDGYELSEAERAEFDYIDWEKVDEGTDGAEFVRYKGQLYHLGDIERSHLPGWDGQVTDTFFSAVLFKWVREEWGEIDPDHIIVGRCYA